MAAKEDAYNALIRNAHLCDAAAVADIQITSLVALHVRSAYQRQGVGSALIAEMAKRLQARGAASLMLTTIRENLNARRIHERLGGQLAGDFSNDISEGVSIVEVVYG